MRQTMLGMIAVFLLMTACAPKSDSPSPSAPSAPGPIPTQNTTGTRGGGDVDVVAFLHYGNQVAQWLKAQNEPLSLQDATLFSETVQKLAMEMDRSEGGPSVVFVTEPLKDDSGAPKMAIFKRQPITVWVHRDSWKGLKVDERYALVCLEVLGLLGLDNRYSLADSIRENIHKISGIPNDADQPHITRSGIVFKGLSDLKESAPRFRLTSGFFDILLGSETWRAQGAGLALIEMDRITQYKKMAHGFRSLPAIYKMDVLTTTATSYSVLHADGAGFEILQTFLFRLPSELLTQNIHDYLEQADRVLNEFEKEKAQMSEGALTQLQAIRSRIQNLLKVFGGSQQYGPDHDQWKMVSPYSPYFDLLFGKMRQEFNQRGCLVPSTYSTTYEQSIAKLFALPLENPDADLETLRQQSELLTRQLIREMGDIATQWSLLANQENLKAIRFHSVAPYPDEDMVTGTADLIRIAIYYADAIEELRTERFHEETRDLESILTQLQSGNICAH